MTDDSTHKVEDKSAHESRESPRLDNPETNGLVNASGASMRSIESQRTNISSGSFDQSQELSIEIDFGNGHRESRLNRGAAEDVKKDNTDQSKTSQYTDLTTESMSLLTPALRVTDLTAAPVQTMDEKLFSDATDASFRSPNHFVDIKTGLIKDVIGHVLLAQEQAKPIDFNQRIKDIREKAEAIALENKNADALLSKARTEIKDAIKTAIKDPLENQQFLTDMQTFERTYRERVPFTYRASTLEMAETYKQVTRLLTAKQDALPAEAHKLPKINGTEWRVQAAEQIMHHAAEPTSVDQGVLAVCPTAALQVRQYFREPASISKLVADVILTGGYIAKTGDKSINALDSPINLIPDAFGRAYSVQNDVQRKLVHVWKGNYDFLRSFASQIYDVTAINMALSENKEHYKYRQSKDSEIKKDYESDAQGGLYKGSNDSLLMTWKDALAKSLGPTSADIIKLNRWITGKYEHGFVIQGGNLTEKERQNKHLQELNELAYMKNGASIIHNPEDLKDLLLDLKLAEQWPPIVRIDLSRPPIAKAGAGAHYLVVTDISDDGSKLSYDMTWGRQCDKTGAPSIPTSKLGESITSAKINSCTFVADNTDWIARHSVQLWNANKLLLKQYIQDSIECSIETAKRNHPNIQSSEEVTNWLNSNKWDKGLVEFPRAISTLLSKYSKSK